MSSTNMKFIFLRRIRSLEKDPLKMAKIIQKMDQVRIEMFACNATQAELLLTRLRQARNAFIQV